MLTLTLTLTLIWQRCKMLTLTLILMHRSTCRPVVRILPVACGNIKPCLIYDITVIQFCWLVSNAFLLNAIVLYFERTLIMFLSPLLGCCHSHPPSPFIITQPKIWYSFYHFMQGRRLSWSRHYRKGAAACAQDCVSEWLSRTAMYVIAGSVIQTWVFSCHSQVCHH